TSGADGVVRLAGVPAGPWLTLDVRVPGEQPAVRADIDVVHDRELDVGDIRVGFRRTLRVPVWDAASRPVVGARVEAQALSPRERSQLSGWKPSWILAWLARPATQRSAS